MVPGDPLPSVDAPDLSSAARRLISHGQELSAVAARRFRKKCRRLEENYAAMEVQLASSDERLVLLEQDHQEAALKRDMAEVEPKLFHRPTHRWLHMLRVGLVLILEGFACYLGVVIFDKEATAIKFATAISAAYVLTYLGHVLFANISASRRVVMAVGFGISAMVAGFTMLRYLYFAVVSPIHKQPPLPLVLSVSLGLISVAVLLAAGWLYREYNAEAPLRSMFGRQNDAQEQSARFAKALQRERVHNHDLRKKLAQVEALLESFYDEYVAEVDEIRWRTRELIERYEGSGSRGVVVPPSTDGAGWRGRRYSRADYGRRRTDHDV
jgi:hypothetical protein